MKKLIISISIFCTVFWGCSSKYHSTHTYSKGHNLNAVVEFPAESNTTIDYTELSESFKKNHRENKKYLPYLGNYGFIAGTQTKTSEQGDGYPVDILILSEFQKTGKTMEVKPVALLKLIDKGDLDYKVIALPANEKEDAFHISQYSELKKQYPAITIMIEDWFIEYNKIDAKNIVGWGDEKEAMAYVNANLKTQP